MKTGRKAAFAWDAAAARDENTIGRALQDARKAAGLTSEELCNALEEHGIKVQKAAVSKWELGVTVPNAYQFVALCTILGIDDAAAHFSGEAVLNKEGLRKLADYKNDLIATGLYAPESRKMKIRHISMPVSMLPASAGTGSFLDGYGFEQMSVPEDSVPKGAEFGIRVSGDSMEPVYADGQIVWVKQCRELRRGDTGIFVLDGEGYIKVYGERVPENTEGRTDSEGGLHPEPVLISYNSRYAPIYVTEERNLQIIGKVL